jgi:FkbM family methyltransferase
LLDYLSTRTVTRLSRQPARALLWQLYLCAKLCKRPRFSPGRVKFDGLDLQYFDWLALLSTYWQIMVHRWYAYDPHLVARWPVILDCGANIGLASLHFARMSPEARVIAFEPDPILHGILQENLSRNSLQDRVETVNAALWIGAADEIGFAPDGGDGGHIEENGRSSIRVKTAKLRDYLRSPVGLLKMDIEGAEIDVIGEAADVLPNARQIILEYHSPADEPQRLGELISSLESSGFRVHINNTQDWANPLIRSLRMGRLDEVLIIYAVRDDPSGSA